MAAVTEDVDQASKGTVLAKNYYDSDDAQKFYSAIWGEETLHIGRYDLLTAEDKKSLSLKEQISKAEAYHEDNFIDHIQAKFPDQKVVMLDMGCGYGGLLRRLVQAGIVQTATGCDISQKMCHQARRLNKEQKCADVIHIAEESYLSVESVKDGSCDLVISMDAFLHVGPKGQADAMKEAARVLKSGGWMIFSDIMQQEEVDADEMKPIYDRIHLSKMGTISNYQQAMGEAGFINFKALPNSSTNVSNHYGTVCKVLEDKGDEIGISRDYQQRMKSGLTTWRDLGEKNIVWGFLMAQKK